jgi:hypothetical protein
MHEMMAAGMSVLYSRVYGLLAAHRGQHGLTNASLQATAVYDCWTQNYKPRSLEPAHKITKSPSTKKAVTFHHKKNLKFEPRQIETASVKFEVFRAVTMKNAIFWDVTPCGSYKN